MRIYNSPLPSYHRHHHLMTPSLNIGWVIKRFSIKRKKKCTEKWRWPRRELKIWYMFNNIMVSIFPKKYFSTFVLYSWYGHLNVKFWQLWHSPNIFKTCSEIVLCYLYYKKYFILGSLDDAENANWNLFLTHPVSYNSKSSF